MQSYKKSETTPYILQKNVYLSGIINRLVMKSVIISLLLSLTSLISFASADDIAGILEKARVIDPFGHARFDPSGKKRLTP